jgi:hypothetical protein
MRCFLVGKGASLKGFDFERLRNEHTICLNHAVFFVPEPNGLCFCDQYFYKKYKDFIDNFDGYILATRGTKYPGGKPNIKGYGTLSGLYALSEVVGKFDEIYLLGYDLNNEKVYPYFADLPDLTEDWWNKNIPTFYHDPSFTRERIQMFEGFKDYPVYNCNPDSAIRCFKFKDIEAVLNG